MNTEDKAKQLCREFENATILGSPLSRGSVAFQASIEMAKQKNEQFIKWLTCDAKFYNKYGCEIDTDTDALIEDFKQAMKGK